MSWTEAGEKTQVRTLALDPAPLTPFAGKVAASAPSRRRAAPAALEFCIAPVAVHRQDSHP